MKKPSLDTFKPRRAHKGWYRLRRPKNGPETTRPYTPEEAQKLAHAKHDPGIIRPDTGDLHVPADLIESGGGKQVNAPPLVMLVIITLALIFIATITYFVSQMPPKT